MVAAETQNIENGSLFAIIEVPRGLKFGGRRSYASTDDFIMVFYDGMVRDFSIGLSDVICECNTCNESLSSVQNQCCEHLPGQENAESEELHTLQDKRWGTLIDIR